MTYPVPSAHPAKWVRRYRGAEELVVPLTVMCQRGHRETMARPAWLQIKRKARVRRRGF